MVSFDLLFLKRGLDFGRYEIYVEWPAKNSGRRRRTDRNKGERCT